MMKNFNILDHNLKGMNLIEASAGTGKTYNLSGIFIRLMLEKRLLIDQILAVTYTEAATKELRLRIRKKIRDAYIALRNDSAISYDDELIDLIAKKYRGDESSISLLQHALRNFDEASIYTIHSFCQRMLLENAFESNSLFDTELVTDNSDLIQGIVDDFWRIHFYPMSQNILQYAKSKKISPENLLNLVKKNIIDKSLQIVPYTLKPATNESEKKLHNVYNILSIKWFEVRNEIEDILLHNKALDRKKYQSRYIPRYIIEMDHYLSSGNPIPIYTNFTKFSFSNISISCKQDFDPPFHSFFELCDEYLVIYNATTDYFDRYLLSLKLELFNYIKIELERRKNELNIRSFDDLLLNMHNALSMGTDSELARIVRKKYKAALIDEFQDTDPVQYDIFTSIFGANDSILYLIGDPKQSIYGFRGADIFAYINASTNIKNRSTLITNWRSEPKLIQAINIIFSRQTNSFLFKEISFHNIKHQEKTNAEILLIDKQPEEPLNIWFIPSDNVTGKEKPISKETAGILTSQTVTAEISRLIRLGYENRALIGDRALGPGDIAVLVRKNYQAKIIQDELSKLNIPGVLYGAENIFESQEAMEIERVMTAILKSGNDRALKAALSTDLLGLSGNELYQLQQNEMEWEEYADRFLRYHDIWAQNGFMSMSLILLKEENVRVRMLSLPDGERRITDVLHCFEILHIAEVEHRLGMAGLVKWFATRRTQTEDSFENEIRLETDRDAVKIVTIHKSKGLEYPVVFCPFTWDGSVINSNKPFTFHNPDKNNRLTLDIGANEKDNIRLAERENLAENIRLFYVALTRARHRCYIVWGRINKSETSAPAYIFHNSGNLDPDDIVNELKKHVQSLSSQDMLNELRLLEELGENSIKINLLPETDLKQHIPYKKEKKYQNHRLFTGDILNNWRISSYSSLISANASNIDQPDHGMLYEKSSHSSVKSNGDTIFDFPRGLQAGSFIHNILENIDFTLADTNSAKELIDEKLIEWAFDTKWQKALWAMINNIIFTPLESDKPDFILHNVGLSDRLNELEFYFPHDTIQSERFSDIFARYNIDGASKDFARRMLMLGFKPVQGYIRGFIDMVFRYNDRYYIVDWKSNHLGDRVKDYSQKALISAMNDHYYFLQYHLYALALHRYLKMRLADYEYDRHFGGIYYIFVRGVDSKLGPSYGIYNDIPSYDLINSLDNYLFGLQEKTGYE